MRKLPLVLLLTVVMALPLDLVQFVPLPSVVVHSITIVAFSGGAFFLIRTLTWTSLLLLTRWSFWQAFELSWAATRGHTLRIVVLFVVLIHVALPLILVDLIAAPRYVPVGMSAFGALMMLAVAQIYVSTPTTVESASVSTGRKSTSSVPPISAA